MPPPGFDVVTWPDLLELGVPGLTILCGRLNDILGDAYLTMDWPTLPEHDVLRAMKEIGRWQMPEGDPLGVLYQLVESRSKLAGIGSFYTPYSISLMMATMLGPEPGKSVMDPCCGSGGMLLAAIEACRAAHGPDCEPLRIFGMDIDPQAVRLCQLNLALAGYHPNGAPVVPESEVPPERVAELKAQARAAMPFIPVQDTLF